MLISIANHAGQDASNGAWEAWPGIALLQRESGLARERTVQDALARLVEAGHIERVVNGAPDERVRKDRRSNLYRILLTNGVTCGDTRCRWCGMTGDDERGDGSRRHGVPDRDATGCRETSPEPSLNRTATELQPRAALAVVPTTPAHRAQRLPEPFILNTEMREWAATEFPFVDVRVETAKFCDYWRSESGARARKVDWVAAWRNWIRKAGERRTNGHGPVSKLGQSQANLAAWAEANRGR